MNRRIRLRKLLALVTFGTILLGIQCPPMVIDSIKTGTVTWVSGGSSLGTGSNQFGDYLLNLFTGNLAGS